MGQNNSSPEIAEAEINYLSENTDLSVSELRELYLEFSKKDKITKKEFLQQFKRTFPR